MRVYFVRHGQTDSNIGGLAIHTDDNGPLNATGIAQVEQTSRLLAQIAPKIDLIMSSPYLRTCQTAEIIAKQYKIPVFLENELSEANFKGLNGKTIDEVYRILQKRSKAETTAGNQNLGESWGQIAERMMAAIGQAEAAGFEHVVVVSHSLTIHIAVTQLVHFEAGSQADISQVYDNASVSTLEGKNGAWKVLFLNRCN